MKFCYLTVFVFVLILPNAVGQIGGPCNSNGVCGSQHTYCKLHSPTCILGACECSPGFFRDHVDGQCKNGVDLDGVCHFNDRSLDFCLGPLTTCLGDRCQCQNGTSKGSLGECDKATALDGKYQSRCWNSSMCSYNLECTNNYCYCQKGYKVLDNKQKCEPRQLRDVCNSSDDCSAIKYGICDKGNCACFPPSKMIRYQSAPNRISYACGFKVVGEGAECSLDQGTICSPTFVCGQCFQQNPNEAAKSFCLRIIPDGTYTGLDFILSSPTSRNQPNHITGIFLLSVVLLGCGL